MADGLDMTDGRDRRDLRAAVSRGWGVTPAKQSRFMEALDRALEAAIADGNARDINSCVKTLVSIVGQVQADEHLDRKYAEAAAGNAESVSTIRVVYEDDAADDG